MSYASEDRPEVLRRLQMLRPPFSDVAVFQDVLSLNPGDRWEKQLYLEIEDSDLFLLFWSTHAKNSSWVEREWRYALGRQGPDGAQPPAILPVILEGPPPPEPPKELAHLHFNDSLLYLAGFTKISSSESF